MEAPSGFPLSVYSLLFPELQEQEFQALKQDIRKHGQREPIALWRGQILDGRHRYRACLELGLPPAFSHLPDETEPLPYVISGNRHRRNPTPSQNSASAFYTYQLSHGILPLASSDYERNSAGSANLQISPLTQREAADLFGVSVRSLAHAAAVLGRESNATRSLRQAVERGRITVSDGARVADESREVQDRAVAKVLDGKSKSVFGAARRVRSEMAQETGEDISGSESWRAAGGDMVLHNSEVHQLHRLVEGKSANCIIAHVRGDTAPRLLRELVAFADHALAATGVMAVLCVVRQLDGRHGVTLSRMPLLVYGRGDTVLEEEDVIQLPPPDPGSPKVHMSQRHALGMELVLRRFCHPGGLVCDPLMVMGAGTALTSLKVGCRFVGNCLEQSRFETVRDRLARADQERGSGR